MFPYVPKKWEVLKKIIIDVCIMAKKSKIETSPHFNEIVDLLLAGYSGRYVSDYLKNEYDEIISYKALNNYKKNKLNVKAAVKKKVIEKQKKKKKNQKSKAVTNEQQEAIDKNIEKLADKEISANESFEAAVNIRYDNVNKIQKIISQAGKHEIDLSNFEKIPPKDRDYYKETEILIKIKKLELEAIQVLDEQLDDDSFEENLTEGILGLAESIEKSRQKYFQEKEK